MQLSWAYHVILAILTTSGEENNKVVGGVASISSLSAFDVLVILNYIIVVD